MSHARPHLTTHTRSKGHSALAGVAYRLGLRLFDKRQGVWHDYRHRSADDEVVAAFTLAPIDAPPWATDPAQVWAAAEAAEKRRDSQVAHDFRIPLPLGLTDAAAVAMARAMAQHLVDDLGTIVSVGVHRDNAVDAMGIAKPLGKVGLHAHLYLPTRRLAFIDAPVTDGETAAGQAGNGTWAFSDKLKVLAHKVSASACIERMNSQWAALANTYAAEAGLVPDFTHLSYARLGLAKLPQVTLGAAVTAMERRGVATWKAEPLRAPASVPVEASTRAIDRLVAKRTATELENSRAWLSPANPIIVQRVPSPPSLSEGSPSGLAGRFLAELAAKQELPQPTPAQRSRLIAWLQRIEHALRRLAVIALRVADLRDRRQRDDGARVTFLVELDDRRKRRAEARKAIADWLDAHPWQVRLKKMMGGTERKPTELMALEGTVAALNTYIQQLKRGVADAAQRVAELDGRIGLAEQEQVQTQATLNQGADFLHGLEPLYGMVLLSVAAPAQVPALTAALPPATKAGASSEATVTFRTPDSDIALKPEPVRGLRPGMP